MYHLIRVCSLFVLVCSSFVRRSFVCCSFVVCLSFVHCLFVVRSFVVCLTTSPATADCYVPPHPRLFFVHSRLFVARSFVVRLSFVRRLFVVCSLFVCCSFVRRLFDHLTRHGWLLCTTSSAFVRCSFFVCSSFVCSRSFVVRCLFDNLICLSGHSIIHSFVRSFVWFVYPAIRSSIHLFVCSLVRFVCSFVQSPVIVQSFHSFVRSFVRSIRLSGHSIIVGCCVFPQSRRICLPQLMSRPFS